MTNTTENKSVLLSSIKLTQAQKLEAQKEKLAQDAKRIADNQKVIDARIAKADANRLREYDFKKKLHSGGMMAMVGLFEYVYSDKIRDNSQDDLMANLIVGSLLNMSKELNCATGEQLQLLWDEGKKFRLLKKEDRVIPKKNEKLDSFMKIIEEKLKTTKQQPNVAVQSDV